MADKTGGILHRLGAAVGASISADIAAVSGKHTVPAANATANTDVADVGGNKTDALVEDVGTTKSLMGYIKGLIQELAQRDVAQAASDTNSQVSTYEDVVNITDKGVLTGVTQGLYGSTSGASVGTIRITIDGVAILTDTGFTHFFFTYNEMRGYDASLAFNHRFDTSLRIEHKTTAGSVHTKAAYTID